MAIFKSSARSVDMLGRQQIAGIPTAVSEIFKNAYDAYATVVRGDFYPDQSVLTIRDDGIGMSIEDFTTRWLTIGTESKTVNSNLRAIPRPPHLAERRQMGEKGIGRLAIAALGPQLIVVSRGRDDAQASLDSIVVSLVQWSMFEIPGITLDEVVVPVRELDESRLDKELLDDLRAEVVVGLQALGARVPPNHANRIISELALLDFDLKDYLRVSGPNVLESSGTAFIVCPVNPDVTAAMQVNDPKPDEFSVSDFQRFLLGFTNSITPKSGDPSFATQFVRRNTTGSTDLIDQATYFWEDEDFALTDHTIEGEFDEYGTFRGRVSVYGQDPVEAVQPWSGGRGRATACGPFKIKFGYVQGKASESNLNASDFSRMTSRLEKIGGLYVYRDGIRVLPYGNAEYDYLEIEKRRSLNAATAYFSYRRMFGAIELDSTRNHALQEKAGREGFRENAAYRDFRDVLKSFLTQLAASYFSAKGAPAEDWRTRRQQISEVSRRKQEESARRQALEKELAAAMRVIEGGLLTTEIQSVLEATRKELRQAQVGSMVLDRATLEMRAAARLASIAKSLEVVRPSDLALTIDLERDWNSYTKLYDGVSETFIQAYSELQAILTPDTELSNEKGMSDVRRERLTKMMKAGREAHMAHVEDARASVLRFATDLAASVDSQVRDLDRDLSAVLPPDPHVGVARELELSRELESIFSRAAERLAETIAGVVEHERSGLLGAEVTSLEERVLDLEEQVQDNLELLQLGQAVQIISHEFESSIRSVRAGLKQFDPWTRSTPRLMPLVKHLKAAFAHLDGYLRLFTPLQRRLQTEPTAISGAEIESFVLGVFEQRLQRHNVRLSASPAFREFILTGFPSTFYPVFVNLVDNAIYWLADNSIEGAIDLAVDGDDLTVSDNGPGVREPDAEYIFERGFSRRRGGRGLGLAISKELLERDAWSLTLDTSSSGARFRLRRSAPDEDH